MRRIGALQSQLRPVGTPAAAAEQRDVAEAAAESMNLLSDAQVKEFITEGFLALPITELGSDFHKNLYDKSKDAFARLAEEQRDPRLAFGELPEMTKVIGSPTLTGALHSLLGADFVQHPHRSMHTKPLGSTSIGGDQDWHKDGHHVPMRHHFARWIICFYYPHATTEDMGPTGVLPGSQFLQIGRHANDGPRSVVSPHTQPADLNGDDLVARDAWLQACAEAVDPQLEEHKVSEFCDYGGTVFVLHFGMLHRACRNLPGSIWRNMFKLQYFRSSAPTSPTWNHTGGFEADPFAYTGASEAQKSVWEASWRWMCGETSRPALPPADDSRLRDLTEALMHSAAERERVTAAYALAKAGAVDRLEAALRHGNENASRSALYGLMALGDAAVPVLLGALTAAESDVAGCWVAPNAVHALTDAVVSPTPTVLQALRTVLATKAQEMEAAVLAEASSSSSSGGAHEGSGGMDHPCVVLRYMMATCIQALGTLGERAVAAGDSAIAAGVCETLLPYATSAEPGGVLEDIGGNGRAVGPSVFSPCGQQPEFWCREGAAIGLLRLSGCGSERGGGGKRVVTPGTPGHHGDDRFIPGLCLAAVDRLQKQAPNPVATTLLPILTAPSVAQRFDAMVREVEAAECPEPWLAGGQSHSSVQWLD